MHKDNILISLNELINYCRADIENIQSYDCNSTPVKIYIKFSAKMDWLLSAFIFGEVGLPIEWESLLYNCDYYERMRLLESWARGKHISLFFKPDIKLYNIEYIVPDTFIVDRLQHNKKCNALLNTNIRQLSDDQIINNPSLLWNTYVVLNKRRIDTVKFIADFEHPYTVLNNDLSCNLSCEQGSVDTIKDNFLKAFSHDAFFISVINNSNSQSILSGITFAFAKLFGPENIYITNNILINNTITIKMEYPSIGDGLIWIYDLDEEVVVDPLNISYSDIPKYLQTRKSFIKWVYNNY